jgi:hypothetical protein
MSRANRITAPLANKTQYVINARFDVMNQRRFRDEATQGNGCGPALTGARVDEIFNINEHELVFRHKPNGRGFTTYSDGRNYVFSALNGFGGGEDDIALAGIAQGSSSGIEDRMNAQGLAIQREGVNTVINTGADKIIPGDTVYWELPADENRDARTYAQNICGVPKHKRCAELTTLRAYRTRAGVTADAVLPSAQRVGLALSAATSGRPLDILFQPGY